MKRLLLTLICIGTLSESLCAKDVEKHPTIRPTQPFDVCLFWMSYYHNQNGKPVVLNVYMENDSIVDGRQYVKTIVEDTDTLLYRQEGDKVYWLDTSQQREVLLLDFSLNVGDEFTTPNKKKYVVEEIGMLMEYKDKEFYYDYEIFSPNMLRLRSLDSGEEDVWIEGVGSVQWGILPACLAENLRFCKKKDFKPDYARVIYSPCGEFNVNEKDYKLQFFPIDESEYPAEHHEPIPDFTFIDDTLHIIGKAELNCLSTYAECCLNENRVDVAIRQIDNGLDPECMAERYFDVRIPGFEPGTYEVGLSGKEHVTLVCDGTSGIRNVNPEEREAKNADVLYDLSGRKVSSQFTARPFGTLAERSGARIRNSQLQKGIYIQNGRKRVK